MRAGAAEIKPRQRAAIVRITDHRPRAEKLVERQRAVEDVAADQAEIALEIERALDLPPEHRGLEARREAVDGPDHDVGDFLAMIVPRSAVRQFRRNVLAEEARDVPAGRRE